MGTDSQRVAVLGAGKMGSAIAGRLAGVGFQLTIWNRTRARAEAMGIGRVADTPADAARDADFVISSLTGPDAVRSVYLGPDGAASAARDQLFIDMSTDGTDVIKELAAAIQSAGSQIVDAPIIGAPPLLAAGQAAIVVGGDASAADRAAVVLRHFGDVRHVGPLGSGERLKLVANSLLGDLIVSSAELQVAGEAIGLRPSDVFWIIQRYVPAFEARRPGLLEDRHEPPLFALRDLEKDLNLAMGLFIRSSIDAPMTALAQSLVTRQAKDTPDLDISSVIRAYRPRRVDPSRQSSPETEDAHRHG
ncbi:MAG: 2-hydroxy-3-oxopropionate reductase [Chloroflexota bacterium]|jgi:3-hydroxyisobutyrate dehydrogenase/2-hydroxy-3-oxopropionate reductase|nr:2-hydroxy-3-oxopropionate reductase [Chloroflexota bacterium]